MHPLGIKKNCNKHRYPKPQMGLAACPVSLKIIHTSKFSLFLKYFTRFMNKSFAKL